MPLLLVGCADGISVLFPDPDQEDEDSYVAVTASIRSLTRLLGVSPETFYFSAQDSTCQDCTDIFGLGTQEAIAWSEFSYHFDFDDSDSGTYSTTGNSRNSQLSGSPRAHHTFHCHGIDDPNWVESTELCQFNVGVRVQDKNGDFDDAFIQIEVQPMFGTGGYYEDEDIWCVSNTEDFDLCPHNDAARHLIDSPAPGNYDSRLILFQSGSESTYSPICVGFDEHNVTIANYGEGTAPLIESISHSSRPSSCNLTYLDSIFEALDSNFSPLRNSDGELVTGFAFNGTYTGLRVGSIQNGPTFHLANFHNLNMDWASSGQYTGEIEVLTAAWNCKNSDSLDCQNVPYAQFGFFTKIQTKSNGDSLESLAPYNLVCNNGCGATNFVFSEIDADRANEHNARFMGLWGTIFSNNWFRGNNIGGAGPKERLTVRPIESTGETGGTLHSLTKNPEILDGINNYRSEDTVNDFSNRYLVAIDNIFNQSTHDPAHESAALIHLGGLFTGEYGNTNLADDSGQTPAQTQFTGRFKVVRGNTWVDGYPYCNLRLGFYLDETDYNSAQDIYLESPAECIGNYNWNEPTAPLSYGAPTGS